jgi:Tfp pilus assembly protein PilP
MRWSWTTLLILALAVVWAPLAAQQEQPATDDSGDDTTKRSADEILEEHEASLRGQRFTYDPGNRRDPFVSLSDLAKQEEGPRPPGAVGMAVDDLDLTGVVDTPGGAVAYVTGSDGKGYMLRVGDRIYKAVVFAIDADRATITFREQVQDPRMIKPYRDRVLRLESTESQISIQ